MRQPATIGCQPGNRDYGITVHRQQTQRRRRRRPLEIGLAAALTAALAARPAAAQEPGPESPAAELDAGPLLGFHEVITDRPRVVAVKIAELTGTRVFELCRDDRRPRLLARLDRNHLLLTLSRRDSLFVVHAPSGRRREIVEDAAFLGQRGDDLVIQRAGQIERVSWREPGEPPRAFGGRPLLQVTLHDNLAFGIARPDDGRPRVEVVSLVTGRSRELWTAPADRSRFRLALSPGGQWLAVAATDARFRGQLVVLDTATGKPARTFENLVVDLSPLASGMPTLEVAFTDDDHVVSSESRGAPRGIGGEFVHVTRSVRTGEVTSEEPYAPLGVHHRLPDPVRAEPRFRIERGPHEVTLHVVGRPEPLAARDRQHLQYEDFSIAPDGGFAAARLGPKRRALTVYAPDGSARAVSAAWSHGLVWLPAHR